MTFALAFLALLVERAADAMLIALFGLLALF